MIENWLLWFVEAIGQFGYGGLVLMMALESTFIPLPSELILPPAGYLVFQGKLDFFLVLGCGVFGSVIGALFNYWLGYTFGKKVILAVLRWCHIREEHYYSAERFFRRHGEISTFVGRLLLGVRHFISFPAGVAKMSLVSFMFLTALGAAIWSSILIFLGYYVGENQELIHQYYREIGIGLLILCIVLVGVYIWWYKKRSHNK